jgi:hypothetical protein
MPDSFLIMYACIVFGFYRKTEVKNRNRTPRFFIFKKTDRFLMSRKPKFFRTEKPNRSFKKNRMPSPSMFSCRVLGALVQFTGHSIKHALPSVTLGEIRLSAQTYFVEGTTLGIERHSTKHSLTSVKLSAQCNARQSAASSRL